MRSCINMLRKKNLILSLLLLFSFFAILSYSSIPANAKDMIIYKSPTCGCCTKWSDAMASAGYKIQNKNIYDLEKIKNQLSVPDELRSCHTAIIDGYVIEGHVPLADIERLLTMRPDAIGLSTPGMPMGSLGMEMGSAKDSYEVILFGKNNQQVFATHN